MQSSLNSPEGQSKTKSTLSQFGTSQKVGVKRNYDACREWLKHDPPQGVGCGSFYNQTHSSLNETTTQTPVDGLVVMILPLSFTVTAEKKNMTFLWGEQGVYCESESGPDVSSWCFWFYSITACLPNTIPDVKQWQENELTCSSTHITNWVQVNTCEIMHLSQDLWKVLTL